MYAKWGKTVTEQTNFPRDSNDTVDFDLWLDHFVMSEARHHKGQGTQKLHGTLQGLMLMSRSLL